MDPEKLNRRPGGREGKKMLGSEENHKRLLKTENNLRVDGGGRERRVGDGY